MMSGISESLEYSSSSSLWGADPGLCDLNWAYCALLDLVPPPLPPSSPEALHVQRRERPLLAREGSMGEEIADSILRTTSTSTVSVRIFYMSLRHGTDGFTSPPKEGMLRIFFARKIRRLNPRTWVPEASMLTTRPLTPLSLEC
jgi:hypothetical protein